MSQAKLDKLYRRLRSCDDYLTQLLKEGVWTEEQLDKGLDNYLKAHDEWWTARKRMFHDDRR